MERNNKGDESFAAFHSMYKTGKKNAKDHVGPNRLAYISVTYFNVTVPFD